MLVASSNVMVLYPSVSLSRLHTRHDSPFNVASVRFGQTVRMTDIHFGKVTDWPYPFILFLIQQLNTEETGCPIHFVPAFLCQYPSDGHFPK